MFIRPVYATILRRLQEPRRFIQVLSGPRQVGKTTLARQLMKEVQTHVHYASADDPRFHDNSWLLQQWEIGRLHGGILILDEIQKIPEWSDMVKRLWDEDTFSARDLKVLLLGSAPLLVMQGLTDSLAGRFELIPLTHWSFREMQEAFEWSLEQYIFFGGYPGSASFISEEQRWANYIKDSLIETALSRDILAMTVIKKPALLRRVFGFCCEYSGQIVSYQKMLGQLQDAGNTTTLAHYLHLLHGVGLVAGIEKFAGLKVIRQKSSSPKLQVLNNALISAQHDFTLISAQENRSYWGRLVESAVGAYLLNSVIGTDIALYYWRDRGYEVDFVLKKGDKFVALEVKSGKKPESLPGMKVFIKKYNPYRTLLIGGQGMALEDFFRMSLNELFQLSQ